MILPYVLSALAVGATASPLAPAVKRASTVPFGTDIFSCATSGTVALSFDDGPYQYTESLLDQLAVDGHKATFFLNGENWGSIDDRVSTVQRMISEGHQVAHHSWSHPDLATLTDAAVIEQMNKLEDKLMTIIGKAPTYMRPPFFSYNSNTLKVLGDLGYHVIIADLDTKDYEYEDPTVPLKTFTDGIASGLGLTLMHDIHQMTVEKLIPSVISLLKQKNKISVPVGQCLGDDQANWYRTSRPGSTTTSTVTTSTVMTSTTSGTATASTSASTDSTQCSKTYTVVSGDYCYKIYTENNISEEQLRSWNGITDEACLITIGQVLCVSKDATATTTSTSAASTSSVAYTTSVTSSTSTASSTTSTLIPSSTSSTTKASTTTSTTTSSRTTTSSIRATTSSTTSTTLRTTTTSTSSTRTTTSATPSATACSSSNKNTCSTTQCCSSLDRFPILKAVCQKLLCR